MFLHLNAALDRRIPAASVPFIQERISCTFTEHHCLSFSDPLLAPPRRDGLGEDIFNAWLPKDLVFTRRSVRFYALSFAHIIYSRVTPRMG